MIDSEQQHYCRHLIEANKKHRVTTTQPIYNRQGVMLLAKGADMDERRAQVLLEHKLLKPLEECVAIADSLNAHQLFDYLNNFSRQLPGLYAVTCQPGFQNTLRAMCLFYERYPLLHQNLTMLALRCKPIYYQGLFCALAGVAIASKLRLSLQEQQTTFVAGLFHDIGFLYLAPELCTKTQDFTAAEWKALQAHPLIAQRFLAMVPDLPGAIGEAIADHHERIDGTVFPRYLFGDKISMVSQIIAATDNIVHNHNRYQSYDPHAHQMLLAALKLSDNIYFESVYDAATVLFKIAPKPTAAINQLPSSDLLLARQQKLRTQFSTAKTLAQQLTQHSKHPGVRSILAAMARLGICVARSGILQPEQEEWLSGISSENSNHDGFSLIEISVMQNQIYDQLVHLKNLMERLVEALPQDDQQLAHFNNSLEKIDLDTTAFA